MTEPNEPTELADDATDDEIVEFNQGTGRILQRVARLRREIRRTEIRRLKSESHVLYRHFNASCRAHL